MEKTTLRKGYVSTLYMINKENIEDFEFLPTHRKLREAQINRILKQLKDGKHFESQIVVNQRGKKMRIIDGGHRITAINMFLEESPAKQIEVNMAVYRDLNDEQEREAFGLWNKGINQSPDDYLNMRKDEIPIIKLLEKDFPCRVSVYTPQGEGIKFKTLIAAYLGALLLQRPGTYDSSVENVIEKSKELGHKDLKFLKYFMTGFIDVFGMPSNKNAFSAYTVITALMRVYYDNVYEQGETYFWEKVKSEVYPNSMMRQFSLSRSRALIKPCVEEMLRVLNKGKRSNLFILRKKFIPGANTTTTQATVS